MTTETPQQLADRLKFECNLSHGMDGICYEDENREVEQEQKIDSNDRPDIPTPAVPFYENIKRK